jgi:hypothetical protein
MAQDASNTPKPTADAADTVPPATDPADTTPPPTPIEQSSSTNAGTQPADGDINLVPSARRSQRGSSGKWLIVSVVLLIILGAAYLAYVLLQPQASEEKQPISDTSSYTYHVTSSTGASSTPTPTLESKNISQNDPLGSGMMSPGSSAISFEPQVEGAVLDTEKKAVGETVSEIRVYFAAGDAHGLYRILSSEMKQMFTEQNLKEALLSTGSVTLTIQGEPTISKEWAKQTVVATHDGKRESYDIILHKEGGQWTFYGTM